jgi:uncharacterized protein (DUF3084 family)
MDLSKLTALFADVAPRDILTAVMAFDVPIPDAAILGIFVVFGLGLMRSHRVALRGMRAQLEQAYAAELVVANRRVHHARSDLDTMKRELEHGRQRKRGLQRKRAMVEKPGSVRPVSVLREVTATGTGRG